MKQKLKHTYRCPYTKSKLKSELAEPRNDEVISGNFTNDSGDQYKIENGIPYFLQPTKISEQEASTISEYNNISEFYDNAIDWLFGSFFEDEEAVRRKMVDLLEIEQSSKVLEVGCGTARDSLFIAERLSNSAELYLQDISVNMVSLAKEKIENCDLNFESHFFVSSATYLPFEDNYFDALYTFGGFNEFIQPKETLTEFSRVVKPGGKVVFGDENIAPWLDETEYAEIIKVNNPIFNRTTLPLHYLPATSLETCLRWIIGNCFYLIDYRVGESEPNLNLDLPHRGWRGGTLRTRFYGQLEGVLPSTKEKVISAAKDSGLSVHEWLDRKLNELVSK